MATRVLLADDEVMVRTGFRLILEADGHEVVGEAGDGEEAVRLARELRPDVTLMDVRMPRIDGLAATRILTGLAPPLTVVVVTTFDLDETVYAALRAGARGFLLKTAGPTLLQEAVRAAADGESMVSPSITTRLLEHFGTRVAPAVQARALVEPLTAREAQIVRLAAQGMTNREMAEHLVVSLSTVKAHLAAAQRKIGARNRTEIAVWAWESGLAHRERPHGS